MNSVTNAVKSVIVIQTKIGNFPNLNKSSKKYVKLFLANVKSTKNFKSISLPTYSTRQFINLFKQVTHYNLVKHLSKHE